MNARAPSPERPPLDPAAVLESEDALRWLTGLVAAAPTNLEDPLHGRWEKPAYRTAADQIVRIAQRLGLATRIYDPLVHDDALAPALHGLPRPNVIVDLDAGAPRTLLILSHYDVVPVPREQRSRWRSPPHTLTQREDGRLYGRGANDDLGSGVVTSLLALGRLAERPRLDWNVRLIAACDEETGGEGGIEAIKAHDARLPPNDPNRFLRADAAVIPDGGPEVIAGSSGLAFLEASFDGPSTLEQTVGLAETLIGLHAVAREYRSVYRSIDWPDHGAPEPVITGRATLTQFDLAMPSASESACRIQLHAETDAGNQIPERVTLVFEGPSAKLAGLADELAKSVAPPFRLETSEIRTSLDIDPKALAVQVVGRAAHGGYPHRGANPVPAAVAALRSLLAAGRLGPADPASATGVVDLRLPPEMELAPGLAPVLDRVEQWARAHAPAARVTAPPARSRSGYAIAPDHPFVVRFAERMRASFGHAEIVGEYGGTDASALRDLRTPSGEPMPAVVFGSMDRSANIHDAEESVDPRLLAAVARTLERLVASA